MSTLGIEIGGTKLVFAVDGHDGTVARLLRCEVEVERGAAGIRNQIERNVPALVRDYSVSMIGVGFGGPVDWRTGEIKCSHQIEGWADFQLASWVRNLSGVPVVVENDANTAALGEALRGAGIGANPVFYTTLGSGVGGGLVADGRIYHGMLPGEAEIGHLRLDRTGTIVEQRCSGWAIDRRVRHYVEEDPTSRLADLVKNETKGEARFLQPALAAGDLGARKILDELALDLAFALSHVTQLFHPEIVVIGGGLSHLGEVLRGAVANALPDFVMDSFAPGPKIAIAKLGESAVSIGAILLAEQTFGESSKGA